MGEYNILNILAAIGSILSLGYNAKVINNLEYVKHNWNFKVFVANHSYGN